ncbi:hypothetical protein E2F43_11315 [Seongchinamella unica]|uniref:Carboxypeptidase regulatory-like domain-containing protein n=1 Tax=Seongchinamella unica TaxID=2547392 RepID=A0A4R5LT08_9GAMM|nr:hypothetical protein [Seongchinamella unica]TDG14069.1 hypothetical protein E2F43_11315 [Seongchinamella unica]
MRLLQTGLVLAVFSALVAGCSDSDNDDPGVELQDNILVFTDKRFSRRLVQDIVDQHEANPDVPLQDDILGPAVSLVKLSGKTNHFGIDIQLQPPEYIDYHATVPGTRVWIAEYPETRDLDLQTDDTGWWTMYVLKDRDLDLEFSFIFEKEDWITTKTNVNLIDDNDNTDFAIQFIDPYYYQYGMLPFVEKMMRSNGYPNFFFSNAMVVTVGKSWGSMHDDRLPHGDPGALVSLSPETPDAIGPIYFNKSVIPDLNQQDVSVDGGVTWLNMPVNGTYRVTAHKEGVVYPTVTFKITDADVEAGVELFIASPPDSLEGDNDSPPGEY